MVDEAEVRGNKIKGFVAEHGEAEFWLEYRCVANHYTVRDCIDYRGACIKKRGE